MKPCTWFKAHTGAGCLDAMRCGEYGENCVRAKAEPLPSADLVAAAREAGEIFSLVDLLRLGRTEYVSRHIEEGVSQSEIEALPVYQAYTREIERARTGEGRDSERPEQKYADRVLRFASRVPCLKDLLGEDDDEACECYGCAGRKYVALAAMQPSTPPSDGGKL